MFRHRNLAYTGYIIEEVRLIYNRTIGDHIVCDQTIVKFMLLHFKYFSAA